MADAHQQLSGRHKTWLPTTLLAIVAVSLAWMISSAFSLPARHEFNVINWELRHLPEKWLYLGGMLIEGGLSPAEEDELLGSFLITSGRIRGLSSPIDAPGDAPAQLERLQGEREGLENEVEAIIEGRLTSVLEAAGLESSLPFFPGARWVFPPVDFEIGQPPRVLSVSLRERIELVEQRPLRPGLEIGLVVELEDAVEADNVLSASAVPVAGLAAYPSVVAPTSDYQQFVEAVAHEWVHHYLAFKPLGLHYFSNVELRTLNETVAALAGAELASLVVQRYPLAPDVVEELAAFAPPEPTVDADAALRALRLDVDAMLAEGRIDEAEELMEEGRLELAGEGVFFRRINQAFFAFRNLYAGDPGSIDPLGGKVQALREQSDSIGTFLRSAASLSGEAELERRLEDNFRGGS